MIPEHERKLIESLKESFTIRVEMVEKEIELLINGDKIFAHDVALAFQSLVLRKQKKLNRHGHN